MYKDYIPFITIIFLAILFIICLIPCCERWQDDCMAEEIAEDVLKHQTGIDVDFTPSSQEGSSASRSL